MRPILMKGHERPLTFLKYNRDGDLLFSCAKDHTPTVWFADNGERLGTYRGHNGAVWCCDVSRHSTRLITGSADQSVKLWDVKTGAQLFSFNFNAPARSVDFSIGDKLVVITTDPFMGNPSTIQVKRIADDSEDQTADSILTITGPQGRINRAVWGPLNKTIISAGEDSVVRIWDSETGKLLKESDKETGHKNTVTSLTKSADWTHFLTGSSDKSAKMWDSRTLTLLKTYTTERPVNACAISPLLDHVVIGGGQDAVNVTMTDRRAGKFEAKFFHKILQEEIGGVKGHFGPINALAFNPDGRSFSSGGEDGYVRLHHFDPDYFNIKILMKGHKHNRDGDLLFSCAKDHTPTVWFADNGERLGTYRGHNGAVWCCDVSRHSTRLITGSADQLVKLWDVKTGAQLFSFNFNAPARSVDFSIGDKLVVVTTDPFMGNPSTIQFKRIADDSEDLECNIIHYGKYTA